MSDTVEIMREIGVLRERLLVEETNRRLYEQRTEKRVKALEEDLEARTAEKRQAENREAGKLRTDLTALKAELAKLKPAEGQPAEAKAG